MPIPPLELVKAVSFAPPYGIEKCRGETLQKELEDIVRAEEWTSYLVFRTYRRYDCCFS